MLGTNFLYYLWSIELIPLDEPARLWRGNVEETVALIKERVMTAAVKINAALNDEVPSVRSATCRAIGVIACFPQIYHSTEVLEKFIHAAERNSRDSLVSGIFMLVSGYFRLPNDIPKPFWRYPMSYISFHFWALQGQYQNDLKGLIFDNQTPDLPKIPGEYILENVFQIDMHRSKGVD